MNEYDIAAQVRGAHNLARQEQGKLGKVEAFDPPMGIDTPPKLPAWQDVLGDAEQAVRQKPLWSKFIKGTPLENDVPVMMADFALRLLQRGRVARGVPASDPVAQSFDALPPEIEGRLAVWLTLGKELHPLTVNLVVRFARALASKLADAERKYGYSDGWRSPEWMDECRQHLMEHIAKGDPRDVAAYCAFLWHHGESTSDGVSGTRHQVVPLSHTDDPGRE